MADDTGVLYVNYCTTDFINHSLSTLGTRRAPRVVVVDNSGEYCAPSNDIEIIATGENKGFPGAVNIGVNALLEKGCKRIVLVNPDCFFLPGAFDRLLDVHAMKGGTLGGIILWGDSEREPGDVVWFAGGSVSRFGRIENDGHGQRLAAWHSPGLVRDTTWVSGCLVVFDDRTWARNGPWREEFFLYLEDVEWCLRFPDEPRRVLMEPLAVHIGGSSTGGRLAPRWRKQLRHNYRYLARKYSRWYLLEMVRVTYYLPARNVLRRWMTRLMRDGNRT